MYEERNPSAARTVPAGERGLVRRSLIPTRRLRLPTGGLPPQRRLADALDGGDRLSFIPDCGALLGRTGFAAAAPEKSAVNPGSA